MSARAKDIQKDLTADVLYQRLGDRWYAFSVVGDEVFFGEVPGNALQEPEENIHVGSENQTDFTSSFGRPKVRPKVREV